MTACNMYHSFVRTTIENISLNKQASLTRDSWSVLEYKIDFKKCKENAYANCFQNLDWTGFEINIFLQRWRCSFLHVHQHHLPKIISNKGTAKKYLFMKVVKIWSILTSQKITIQFWRIRQTKAGSNLKRTFIWKELGTLMHLDPYTAISRTIVPTQHGCFN